MNNIRQHTNRRRCFSLAWLVFHTCFHATRTFPTSQQQHERRRPSSSSLSMTTTDSEDNLETTITTDKNRVYITGLLDNLTSSLDKWILTGNPATKQRATNVLEQIQRQSHDEEWVQQAQRMYQRAGLVLPPPLPLDQQRLQQAQERTAWETSFQQQQQNTKEGSNRSALSTRRVNESQPPVPVNDRLETAVQDKVTLQKQMTDSLPAIAASLTPEFDSIQSNDDYEQASIKVSSYIARAWDTELCSTSIGGLDDVLSQIKRRIWTPLAAPPVLLRELGIQPVRGLLLYGRPGCGKTLVARTLGRILSPLRPISVVSGPEILDKFVGSSEKNLRDLFDNPPDVYDTFRTGEDGDTISKAALHVIVLDEFDAIARARGGNGGKANSQGDAGVARDSVVNQLLAKMDGMDPLCVPTLVVGLTNRRSLIEPALLRPGRFEVQIEVPPPRTIEQRISILRVHTRHMHQAGRLLVADASNETAASRISESMTDVLLPTYEELLQKLAEQCDGFSGASLTGVTRAAASHALERSVEDFSLHPDEMSLLESCVVTLEDFENAIADLSASLSNEDWVEDAVSNEDATNTPEKNDTTQM